MGSPHTGDPGLKEREMSELFVGCTCCGFSAGKNNGYGASRRWCPECGTKLPKMGPRLRLLRRRYLMRQLHYDPGDIATAMLRYAGDNFPAKVTISDS